MDRLTKRFDSVVAYVGDHKTWSENIAAEMSTDAIRDVLDRLAAYEDTGLEPEEVRELLTTHRTERCEAADYDCVELGRYRRAESEGRLIVLPCKVGDTVWRISRTTETIDEVEITAIEIREKIWIEMRDGVCGRTKYPVDFGRVFFTREEAEAALNNRKETSK